MTNDQKIYSFFDESGTDGKSKFLALGLLKVKNVVDFHKALEEIRHNHHFKNEIKFEKVSSPRTSVAKEWIDLFFEFHLIKFYCLVIEKQKVKIPLINLKKWPRFKLYTKIFLDKYLGKDDNISFYFDRYGKAQDREFEEYLLTHIKGLESIGGINSKDYDALQICDLLLGAVRADFEQIIISPYKKEIIHHFQEKLDVERLAEPINKEKCIIDVLTDKNSR